MNFNFNDNNQQQEDEVFQTDIPNQDALELLKKLNEQIKKESVLDTEDLKKTFGDT